MTQTARPPIILLLTSIVFSLTGLLLGIGGAWLAILGGSLYYLVIGVALLAVAVLVWRGRAAALWLYAAIFLGTLAWALWEVGLDFWSLAPRGDVIAPLGVWLLLPFVANRLAPAARGGRAALGGTLVLALLVLGISLSRDPHAI